MAAKDKIKDIGVEDTGVEEEIVKEEVKEVEPFRYGISPSLQINLVRETRVFRFEMPIGAQLVECEEAANECIVIIKKMMEEAAKKQKEAEKKQEDSSEVEESFENLEE